MSVLQGNREPGPAFVRVPLQFEQVRQGDLFARKNNKTLGETLEHKRYAKFTSTVATRYADSLDQPLGTFLLHLKQQGDPFYTRFLNKYGDLAYSQFLIPDPAFLDRKGVYAYLAGEEMKYIGRCRDSMRKRINQGYGKIHPKNCYLDGQATNCHLNAEVTALSGEISLWLYPLDDDVEIVAVERQLIRTHLPPWNIQR